MKHLGLLLLMCVALCRAQVQQMEPIMPELPELPEFPDLPEGVEGLDDEEPLVRCKRPQCPNKCAYGRITGENGCLICECRTPDDICLELGECPEGKRCHVPTCFDELCATVTGQCITECPMMKCVACDSGIYLTDDQGCQTCDCGPTPPAPPPPFACAMPMCADMCEFGYANNDLGCMTCKCNEPPSDGSSEEGSSLSEGESSESSEEAEGSSDVHRPLLTADGCSMMRCRMFCEHGFEKDEQGCDMCRCRTEDTPAVRRPVCPEVMCMMFCEHGFEKDEHGCDMCRCLPVCPEMMCTMYCASGFEKNEQGCNICKCKTDNICHEIFCQPGLNCQQVTPTDCVDCSPVPLCRPTSLCQLHEGQSLGEDEIDMMKHHLRPDELEKFFPGPAQCRPDGGFEPKQCFQSQCFCVDDRGVIQESSLRLTDQQIQCEDKITKILNLSFQLEHDLDDNDVDGALNDIKRLVEETVGDWMSINRNAILLVEVAYVSPGLLLVEINVAHDGLTDLPSAAHHMHKKMRDGHCDLHFKDHILRPNAESVKAEHTYDLPTVDPTEPYIARCWARVRRSRPILMTCLISGIVLILIIITVIMVVVKRKRSASYQFRHKKMENMETFKKNLIMSTEWEKPELVCKDDVKVTFSDDIEKKPLA